MGNDRKIILEDEDFKLTERPESPSEYNFKIKSTGEYIFFPRGTLKELANTDRERGEEIIAQLVPYNFYKHVFFKKTNLTYDSIIAFATKSYIKKMS
ncbi:hypothetical protein J4411_03770 [Candidatus Pacearchaeota archaeon]|nr:hypothetical protein [Candidatus Pacearchaeota archaeon]